MATTEFSALQFLNKVLPRVPGCLNDVAVDAIRDAAIDFCEQTQAWTYSHPDINMVANTASYTLSPLAGTKVHVLHWVWYRPNGRILWPKGQDRLARIYRDWRNATATEPTYITSLDLDANTFQLVPKPTTSQTNGLGPLLCLKPLRTATGMDSKLVDEYLEQLVEGALARLYRIPDRFGNEAKAAAAEARFRVYCTRVYNRVQAGLGRDREVVMRVVT